MQNINNNQWPKNITKLSFDWDSLITLNDIILDPQAYNEIKSYNINIGELDDLSVGEYIIHFWFNINDKHIGERMELKIIIKEHENPDLSKIKEFRQHYSLSESDYSDAKLLELLKKNQFNEEEAFSDLFNDSLLK